MIARLLRKRRRFAGSEAGFTLIEVLVALVVLAIVVAMLPGAFRFAHATWDAAARLDRRAGYDIAGGFLRSRLAEAMPIFEPTASGLKRIAFQGTGETLSFVAATPNGPAGAGLYRFALEMGLADARSRAPALLARVRPYRTGAADSDAGEERRMLVEGVTGLAIRYFGRGEARSEPAWLGAWTSTDALPMLVELTVTSREGGGTATRTFVVDLWLQAKR